MWCSSARVPAILVTLRCYLFLHNLIAADAGGRDARSSAADLKCLSDEVPASSFGASLLQSKVGRSRLEEESAGQRATGLVQKDPAYELRDTDKSFGNDLVEDRDHDIDDQIDADSGTNNDASLPKYLSQWDEEDSDFAVDDYKNGSPESLCWTHPKVDANGEVLDDHVHLFAPIHVQCPPQCPFSQAIPTDKCYKACVDADHCRALHPFRVFGDPLTKQCTATCGLNEEDYVQGCAECASTGICKKCSFWQVLSRDGRKCTDYWYSLWVALSYLGRVLILFGLGFMIYLQYRPVVSPGLLECASRHRELTGPWNMEARPWHGGQMIAGKYRLTAKTHEDNISGMGIALYFRWLRFMLLVAGLLLPILYITFNVSFEIAIVRDIEKVKAQVVPDVFGLLHLGADETTSTAHNGGKMHLVVLTEPELCRYSKTAPKYVDDGIFSKELADERRPPKILPAANGARVAPPSLLQGNMTAEGPHHVLKGFKKVRMGLGIRPNVKVKLKSRAKMPVSLSNEDHFDAPAGSHAIFPLRMTVSLAFAYVTITLLSLYYGRSQSSFERRWRLKHRAHRDFAILVSGLPPTARDPLALQNFFQAALDSAPIVAGKEAKAKSQLQVVAASIAYDFGFCERAMPLWMDLLVLKIETALGEQFPDAQALQKSIDSATSDAPTDVPAKSRFNLYERFARRWLPPTDCNANWEEEARRCLEDIECSGNAYIVVSSALARDRLLALASDQLLWHPTGDQLELSACTTEPPSVLWEAHGHVPSKRQMAVNVVVLLGTVLIWAVSFTPYAYYQIQARAFGQELSVHTDFVLGMLIAVGNNLVCVMIDVTTHHFGLLDKEKLATFTLGLIYVATVTNTVIDIGIVLVALRGLSLDLAMHGTLDQSHYDRILAQELFTLLVPGYLITPYLFAPLLEDFMPAYSSKRLIRSSTGVSRGRAEKQYRRPMFDLAWHYSDLLTNITVCLPLLLFGTHHMYAIVIFLLAGYILTYLVDHFRLLRATTRTWQCTSQLDVAFSYWWSVPTGYIGVVALHWAMEGDILRTHRWMENYLLLAFLVFHCVCYCYLMKWLRAGALKQKDLDDGMSYDEMCKGHWHDFRFYDFVNTNPVQYFTVNVSARSAKDGAMMHAAPARAVTRS